MRSYVIGGRVNTITLPSSCQITAHGTCLLSLPSGVVTTELLKEQCASSFTLLDTASIQIDAKQTTSSSSTKTTTGSEENKSSWAKEQADSCWVFVIWTRFKVSCGCSLMRRKVSMNHCESPYYCAVDAAKATKHPLQCLLTVFRTFSLYI